ncbi:MAG: RDD family protein [Arachnia sp.]
MALYGSRIATPAKVGPRVVARLINAAISGAIFLVLFLGTRSDARDPVSALGSFVVFGAIASVLGIAYVVVQVVLLLSRSTTVGHQIVKVIYLRTATGEDARTQIILRFLVSVAFECATLGLGAVSYFVTYRDGQHWLDRAFGTVGVERESIRTDVVVKPA